MFGQWVTSSPVENGLAISKTIYGLPAVHTTLPYLVIFTMLTINNLQIFTIVHLMSIDITLLASNKKVVIGRPNGICLLFWLNQIPRGNKYPLYSELHLNWPCGATYTKFTTRVHLPTHVIKIAKMDFKTPILHFFTISLL